MGILLESTSVELLSIAIVLLSSIYIYFKLAFTYWEKKGVKQIPPLIPFGNVKELILFRKSAAEVFREAYNYYPNEPYVGMYDAMRPLLLIRDPEVIKHVLVKDFPYFQDRQNLQFDPNLDPLSSHLLYLSGPKWRTLRSKLTPTFTSGKMKMMFHLMTECSDKLKEYLDEPARNGEMLEMREITAKFTTDIIGSCVFGLQFNSINNSESQFRKMGRRVFEPSHTLPLLNFVRMILPSLFKFIKIKIFPDDITNFFMGVVKDTIEYREKNNIVRRDFMDLLIQLKNKGSIQDNDHNNSEPLIQETSHNDTTTTGDGDLEFTDDLLASQAFIFFLAGFETSSTTLSFCLHELALNPEIQAKLVEEVDDTLEKCDGKITYDALLNMSYLDKVVDETLRNHPPGSFLLRTATKPYVIPRTSIQLDIGQRILISLDGLHHDSKYFPNPEKFNPENFSEEAKHTRPHYVHLPFGEGPRSCIALRFGLLQTKLGLLTLLSRYEFSVCEKTEVENMKLDPTQLITTPIAGIWLTINKRSNI